MNAFARRATPLALACLIVTGCGGGGASHTSTSNGHSGAPSATHTIGSVTWQGMKITARLAPPAPFVIFNGTSEQTLAVPRHGGVQLTVTLADAQTAVAIPYATVTATITRGATVLDHERMWPMISADTAPGYVANASLPGHGPYRLRLAITPPVSARHVEYQHVWLSSHTVSLPFTWEAAR